MKRHLQYALLLVVPLLCQCTRTVYLPVEPQHSETIIVRDTTIVVTNAGETAHRTTIDTVSYLHNDYASSQALVEQGVLHHTLSLHPRSDTIKVQLREVHTTDSIPYLVQLPAKTIEVTPRWASVMLVVVLFVVVIGAIVMGLRLFRR